MQRAKMAQSPRKHHVIFLCLTLSLFVGSLNADDCCKDGETQADAEDCTKYLVCCSGEFVSKSCANGTYWDPDTKNCEKDEGQCRPTSCVDGETKADFDDCTKYLVCCHGEFVSKSCDNGFYWNADKETCEKDNGQCKPPTCEEGEVELNPSDCAGYLECVNGSLVAQSCPEGDYFNSTLNKCVLDTCGVCINCTEGDVKADLNNCANFQICVNGKYVSKSCPIGEYWNAGNKTCEKDEGQCNGNSTCTEGETSVDKSDCAGYFVCSNGVLVSKKCPDNTYFNETYGICIIDSEGVCVNCTEGATEKEPTDCTKYKICTNGKYVTVSCKQGDYWNADNKTCELDEGQCNGNSTCTEGETSVDKSDCAGYLVCSNGVLVSKKCPDNTYFEEDIGTCVVDSAGVCINCTEGATKDEPSNCTQYHICAGGKYVIRTCAVGLYWNTNSSRCETDNGECIVTPSCTENEVKANPVDCAGFLQCINGNFVARKCSATQYFNTTSKECEVDKLGVCIPKTCEPPCCDVTDGSTLPVDKNCSVFIQCVGGKVVQQTCPNNLQFNNATGNCDFPWNVQCEDGSEAPIAGPSGTYCESHGDCLNMRDGTMYGKNCSSAYVVCQCECEVNFTCSAGLVFNGKIKACDWPANSGC